MTVCHGNHIRKLLETFSVKAKLTLGALNARIISKIFYETLFKVINNLVRDEEAAFKYHLPG